MMAAYVVKRLRANIRNLGDAAERTNRYRGGVVQGHEPDEHGSFVVGGWERDAYRWITTPRRFRKQTPA
jgi:hypothetical protein